MGRIEHSHINTSVVILIIDENGIFAFEGESQPPIAADIHRPMTGQIAF